MSKPECDFIKGIPPAIAIEQKVNSRNPRSTVGTSTEIYEYLRLLYSRVGRTYSPVSGQEVKKHSTEDIINCMLSHPEGTRYTVLTPIHLREDRSLQQQLEIDLKQGFNRIEVNGEMKRIDDMFPDSIQPKFQMVLQSLNFSVMNPHAPETENLMAGAEETIAKMEKMRNANQSDICTLRGFLFMVRIVQNPVQNGQRYYLDVMQNYEKALKLNPENQLAKQLQQKFFEGMKKQTGL